MVSIPLYLNCKAVYNELKRIQKSNFIISRTGSTYQKLFQKSSIKAFLDQSVIRERLNQRQKTAQLKSQGLILNRTLINEQWKKLCSINKVSSCSMVESSPPLPEFTDLIKLHDKTNEAEAKKKAFQSKCALYQKRNTGALKKYQIRPDLLIRLKRMKERSPHSWNYNPSYSYIVPHVYVPSIKPIAEGKVRLNRTTTQDRSDSFRRRKQLTHGVKRSDHKNTSISCDNETTTTTTNNHALSFESYLNRGVLFNKCLYQNSDLHPKKINKHIASTTFSKMTSREKKPLHPTIPVVINYYPEYHHSIEERITHTKNRHMKRFNNHCRIKQICSSYDVTRDYLSVPNVNMHQ